MDAETIKLVLDYMNSSKDTDELIQKLATLKGSAGGVADSYKTLERQVGTYAVTTSQADREMDRAVEAAVEQTRAQKALADAFEKTAAVQVQATAGHRAMEMRILNLGRAAQDLAQGGFPAIINNLEGIVGGGGLAAGIITAIGTAAYVAAPYIKQWADSLGSAKEKIPGATGDLEKLTETIKRDKDAIEEMRKARELDFFEMEKYLRLTREQKAAEEELANARAARAVDAYANKADRARAGAFREAYGEFGGYEKLVGALGAGGIERKRAEEMIAEALKGNAMEIGNISNRAQGFGGFYTSPEEAARRQEMVRRGQQNQRDEDAFHRQRAARQHQRAQLNAQGQENQDHMRQQQEHQQAQAIGQTQRLERQMSRSLEHQRAQAAKPADVGHVQQQDYGRARSGAELQGMMLANQAALEAEQSKMRAYLQQARQLNSKIRSNATAGLP